MKLPDIEIVAAKVHDAWVTSKLSQGVISRKNETTGEEQMRPYIELSDTVKELDRATVRAVYQAINEAMELEPGA